MITPEYADENPEIVAHMESLKAIKKVKAKKLISDNLGELYISDFSLHSIGVILINQKKFNIFKIFLNDITPHITVLSLPLSKYTELTEIAEKHGMDFDDSYQALIAKENDLSILTMDNDFKKIRSYVKIRFM